MSYCVEADAETCILVSIFLLQVSSSSLLLSFLGLAGDWSKVLLVKYFLTNKELSEQYNAFKQFWNNWIFIINIDIIYEFQKNQIYP